MITKKSLNLIVIIILILGNIYFSSAVFAIKNICKFCNETLQLGDKVCQKCGNPANLCLKCNHQNVVEYDFCEVCNSPLAEMRILSTIATDVRNELKLGQSERAQLEQELKKIEYLMSKFPEKKESYLYQKAKIFRKMNFFAREVETWKEFIKLYPESKHINTVKFFLADSLRKWGYLFYNENKKNLAIEKFKESIEINPNDIDSWHWLGRVYSEIGKKEDAAQAYLEALKQNPENPATIHFLRQLKYPIPQNLLKPAKTQSKNLHETNQPSKNANTSKTSSNTHTTTNTTSDSKTNTSQ